jgi:hypothetical protein
MGTVTGTRRRSGLVLLAGRNPCVSALPQVVSSKESMDAGGLGQVAPAPHG